METNKCNSHLDLLGSINILVSRHCPNSTKKTPLSLKTSRFLQPSKHVHHRNCPKNPNKPKKKKNKLLTRKRNTGLRNQIQHQNFT